MPRQAVLEQPAPVVGGALDAEPQEREAGEGEQRGTGADGRVDDERLPDVGEHVPGQEPPAAHARRCAPR